MRQFICAVVFLTAALALVSPFPEEVLPRDTPSYCTVNYNVGTGSNGAYYLPKCGISYFGQTEYSWSHTVHASDYMNCLNNCDNDATCVMFSFNKSTAAAASNSNCYIIEQENWHGIDPPYTTDSNIDSGDYDIADSTPPPGGGSPCC